MYKILNVPTSAMIYRISDEAWIPSDEANTDYKEYLEWVAKGNTAEEYIPEEV
jgi:hypothetical protein